jgi:nucleoside-diphosphate-sugar epimerase
MTRQVMVLGGTGFLGSHVCEAFHTAGFRVLSVSRREVREPGSVRSVSLDLAEAGVAELGALFAEAEPDVVVNAAGMVWRATEPQMQALNADFVDRLVAALSAAPGKPRLIQLGSAHEYGPSPAGTATAEDQAPAPVSVYGRTKLLGTQAVLRAVRTTGLDAVVLRIANVSGPGAPTDSLPGTVAHRIADLAATTDSGGRPPQLRLAPLRAWRDFVDVRDVADAVLAAALAPAAEVTGQVLNVASGVAVHVRDLVDRLIALAGLPVQVVEEQGGSTLRTDLEWQRLDVSRARTVLGWQPSRDLDESLAALLVAVGPPEQRGART